MADASKIRFHCPNCSKALKVVKEQAGKRAKCPECKEVVVIPALSQSREVASSAEQPHKIQAENMAAIANEITSIGCRIVKTRTSLRGILGLVTVFVGIPAGIILPFFLPLAMGGRVLVGVIIVGSMVLLLVLIFRMDKNLIRKSIERIRATGVSDEEAARVLVQLRQFQDSALGSDFLAALFPLGAHVMSGRRKLTGAQPAVLCLDWRRAAELVGDTYIEARVESLAWASLLYLTFAEKRKIVYIGRPCWPALAEKAKLYATRGMKRTLRLPLQHPMLGPAKELFGKVIEHAAKLASVSREEAERGPGYYEWKVPQQTGCVYTAEEAGVIGEVNAPRITATDVREVARKISDVTWLTDRLRDNWI